MGKSRINKTEVWVRECFSERLRALRKGRKLSQDELGADLGLSRGSISYYEQQNRTAPIDVLYTVADYFNVSADFLLGLKEEPDRYIEEVKHDVPGTSYSRPLIFEELSALVPKQSELWSAFARSWLSLPAEPGLRDSLFAAVMDTVDAYQVAAQFIQSGKPIAELVAALRSTGVSAELSMSILAQVSGLQENTTGAGHGDRENA